MTLVNYIITLLKLLTGTERQTLAASLRTDTNAWNAIGGQISDTDTESVAGTIAGTVSNDAPENVENACVMAYGDAGTYTGKTAADGTYSIAAPAGTYTVVFGAYGCEGGETSSVAVTSGATTTLNKTIARTSG